MWRHWRNCAETSPATSTKCWTTWTSGSGTACAGGEFTEEQARADLDLALWYAYACNNIGDYDYYYKAAQWMPASEPAAEAAKSGIWYYRYACALMYCGRLEEARHYAETGVALDPAYPWGWLEVGKLRAHFGDQAGALEAVARGLELVPGDYEFTTLRREILEGRTLEEMEFHWIDRGVMRSCRPARTKVRRRSGSPSPGSAAIRRTSPPSRKFSPP